MNIYNPSSQPTLAPNSLKAKFDPGHGHGDFLNEVQLGFGHENLGCGATCPPGATAYSYVPTSETAPYAWFMENYASADEVFQWNQGPSFVSHQYLLAAQSGGIAGSRTAYLAEADNPGNQNGIDVPPTPLPTGNFVESDDVDGGSNPDYCSTSSSSKVASLDMSQHWPEPVGNNPTISPACESYANGTIPELMVNEFGSPAYQDWQYVAHQENGYWSAPTAVQDLYNQWSQGNPDTQPFAIDQNAYNFVQNLNGNGSPVRPVPYLAYLTPCKDASDHATSGGHNGNGPAWVAAVINAIGTAQSGSLWSTSVIIVTWDDWGGWFDHVNWMEAYPNAYPNESLPAPNPSDPNEWGFRVPLIVISPYANGPGYVSHALRSQGAILNFIEEVFNLPSLKGDDYWPDPNGNGAGNSLDDLFNFKFPAPLPFHQFTQSYTIPRKCQTQ